MVGPTKRIQHYNLKNKPEIRAKYMDRILPQSETFMRAWLRGMDGLEKWVMQFLSTETETNEKWDYYIAYAKKELSKCYLFDLQTQEEAIDIIIEEGRIRGLDPEFLDDFRTYLEIIGEHLEEALRKGDFSNLDTENLNLWDVGFWDQMVWQ